MLIFLEYFLFKKSCFLHKVYNKKCRFLCFFIFLFYHFSVLQFFSCKFLLFFLKRIVLLKLNIFQKCRFLHKVLAKNADFDVFYFSIFPFFQFLKFFNVIFFGKKIVFT